MNGQGMNINIGQEQVLAMLGAREVRIAALTGELARLSNENAMLRERVKACKCIPKIGPVAPQPPAEGDKSGQQG